MQAAHDAELRRVLLRLTAALGLHVGGAGGAGAAAAAAAELDTEAGTGASAEAGWGSDGNARFAHAKVTLIEDNLLPKQQLCFHPGPLLYLMHHVGVGTRTCLHGRLTSHLSKM